MTPLKNRLDKNFPNFLLAKNW